MSESLQASWKKKEAWKNVWRPGMVDLGVCTGWVASCAKQLLRRHAWSICFSRGGLGLHLEFSEFAQQGDIPGHQVCSPQQTKRNTAKKKHGKPNDPRNCFDLLGKMSKDPSATLPSQSEQSKWRPLENTKGNEESLQASWKNEAFTRYQQLWKGVNRSRHPEKVRPSQGINNYDNQWIAPGILKK